jgi:diguanylate cyclase (GGDEF)-like protein
MAIEESRISGTSPGATFKVTASFGLSTIKNGAENLQKLIDQADKALYVSKNSGRNMVTPWSENIETEATIKNVEFIPGISPTLKRDAVQIGRETGNDQGSSAASASSVLPVGTGASMNDSLTGLPNRAHFRKTLSNIISKSHENNQFAAVMLLDIDMFKRINNALGYSAGDNLLKEVANRLGKSLRATDPIGRLDGNNNTLYGLGGDEFGILLTEMESEDHVGRIVERIINSISSPIILDNQEIHLTCSSGICMFPIDGDDADTLLTHASLSLQQAKCSGHNSYQFYNANYSEKIQKDFELENELRFALDNNELELYFQPKVDLATMRIKSMESLIRWNHPEKGMIPPNDFIPVAESSGLITSIGQWVLHAACAQARKWNDGGCKLSVAVNLSALQFRQKDLLEKILYATHTEGASPEYIELEITESTIMENIGVTANIMDELHAAGYTFAIDDFGTGYSSLEHLKRFPISTIKIDRSFVNDITSGQDDAAIVRAIVAMAHSMGLKVVAEGVETDEQLAFLMYLKCDEIQGYLFSRPLPAAEATKLLEAEYVADDGDKEVAQTG